MTPLPSTASLLGALAMSAAALLAAPCQAALGSPDARAVQAMLVAVKLGNCRVAASTAYPAGPSDMRRPGAEGAGTALERMRMSQLGEDVAARDSVFVAPASQPPPDAAPRPTVTCADDGLAPDRGIAPIADVSAPAADRDSELGSMAIPVEHTRFDDRWDRVRRAPPASLMRATLKQAGVTRGLGEADIFHRVNIWVNHQIAYVNDDRNYRDNDYWATAGQTIARRSGDCEDFAILKMQLLIAAGIDSDRVKLVLLRDLAVNADHALLLVQSDTGKLALDNMTDRLYDGSLANDVRPILSFSGAKRWIHGYRDAEPVPANAAAPDHRAATAIAQQAADTGQPADRTRPVVASFQSVRLSMVRYGPCALGCGQAPGLLQ